MCYFTSPMKRHRSAKTRRPPGSPVRRSFVLPARLVEAVFEATPKGGPGNLNAIVRCALEEYVARREEEEFAREMEEMARDPDIIRVNAEILRDFRGTEGDGLAAFPWTGGRPVDPAARAPRGPEEKTG